MGSDGSVQDCHPLTKLVQATEGLVIGVGEINVMECRLTNCHVPPFHYINPKSFSS